MQISEVVVTENDVDTAYAALCPSDQNVSNFLEKIIHELIMRKRQFVNVPFSSESIDAKLVTGIAITTVWAG